MIVWEPLTSLRIKYWIFCVLLLATSASHAGKRLIQEATYEGKYSGFKIKMTRSLYELDSGKFLLRAKAKSFLGTIEEHEEFLWSNKAGITPVQYRYKQRVMGIKRVRSINYDWDKRQVVSIDKKKRKLLRLEDGILGPMTYQLQLQLDHIQGNDDWAYTFINRGKVKQYSFTSAPPQRLIQNGLDIDKAVKMERVTEDNEKRTILWLDVDHQFSLALFEHNKGDKVHSFHIKSNKFYPPLTNTPFEDLATVFD